MLEKHDLSWDLRVPYWHLEEAAEVVREHPKLRIVLNHTGYALHRTPEGIAQWRRGMEALAACPNVWCKISALNIADQPWTLAANKPIILEAIRMFGVGRCMFASNFPVDGLKGSWDYIYSQLKASVAHLPIADRRKLFAENAIAFYRPVIGSLGWVDAVESTQGLPTLLQREPFEDLRQSLFGFEIRIECHRLLHVGFGFRLVLGLLREAAREIGAG